MNRQANAFDGIKGVRVDAPHSDDKFDHTFECAHCHDAVDPRDLGDVFHHEADCEYRGLPMTHELGPMLAAVLAVPVLGALVAWWPLILQVTLGLRPGHWVLDAALVLLLAWVLWHRGPRRGRR